MESIVNGMGQHRTLLTILALFAVTAMIFAPSWHSSSTNNALHDVAAATSHAPPKGVVVVCPAGFIPSTLSSTAAASSAAGGGICTPCTAGSFCNEKFEKITCPIGSYCPIASSSPISCGNGQTTVAMGSISEIQCQCSVGSYRTPDTTKPCHECPEDTYCPDGIRLYSCESGTHSPTGSKLAHDCTCAAGLVLIDGNCIKCTAGSICTHGKMKKCEVNHYCPEGAGQPIACPDNTISVEGSSHIDNCTCNIGSYPVVDGTTKLSTCTSCPSGSYCNDGRAITPCGDHYTSRVGSKSKSDCICDTTSLLKTSADKTIECVACPRGHKCNGTEISEGCPENFYCEVGKGGPPTPCPQDRPKSPLGSTEVSQCRALTDCDDGTYKEGNQCLKCPRGSYCLNGVRERCKAGWWCAEGSSLPTLCLRPDLGEQWPSISSGQSEDGQTDPCWPMDISASKTPTMTAWMLKPLDEVVDNGTGNGHDNEDGPWLKKTAAVIRCDNMHPGGDGVSLAQFKYWTVLEQAMCSRRHWILPNWRKRYDSHEFLPWEAIWEWQNFSRGLMKDWGIAAVPPRRMEQDPLPGGGFNCVGEGGPLPPASTQVVHGDWGSLDKTHHADGNVIAFRYLRPAPNLMAAINEVRKGWGVGEHITCLHLRTESDWVQWFNGPSRQTLAEQAQRFRASYDLAFGNSTYKASLKRPNDQAEVHARLFAPKRLYIAGEHAKDEFDEIIKLFLPMYPLGVFSKATIGLNVSHSWDKKGFSNIEFAVIDREICSGADQFIGNAFSGWSISVYGRRIYSPKYSSMGSWLANGQYNWMTNPLEKDESIAGPLNPYCPNAFLTCPHFTG